MLVKVGSVWYNQKAAGGAEGLPAFTDIRGCKRHHARNCGICATAVNHGDRAYRRTNWRQKVREQGKRKGLAFKASWYERQTQTLEKLRRNDAQHLDRYPVGP